MVSEIKIFLFELCLYICNHIVNKIPFHFIRLLFYRKIMQFKIGSGSTICLGCTFDTMGKFSMGQNSVINANCRLDNRGVITIGDNVSISEKVIILTADHDMDKADMEGRNKPIFINNYVWIGTEAMILPGCNIGYGAVLAAKSLLTKSTEPFDVMAGIPAKFIKERKCKENYTYSASYKRLFK